MATSRVHARTWRIIRISGKRVSSCFDGCSTISTAIPGFPRIAYGTSTLRCSANFGRDQLSLRLLLRPLTNQLGIVPSPHRSAKTKIKQHLPHHYAPDSSQSGNHMGQTATNILQPYKQQHLTELIGSPHSASIRTFRPFIPAGILTYPDSPVHDSPPQH